MTSIPMLSNTGPDVRTDLMYTELERLTLLEYKTKIQGEMLVDIDHKLDELLQLRAKGFGVFWLASALFGTGIIGALFGLISLVKAH